MNDTRKGVLSAVGNWLIIAVLYLLLYEGLENGLWPMIAHFRHMDWKVPALVDVLVSSLLGPFIVGCLIGGALRRQLTESPLPLLFAPLIMIVLLGFTSDSFYPPWWTEALTRFGGGVLQGAFAWAGWFLCRRIIGGQRQSTPRTEIPRPSAPTVSDNG